MDIGVLGSEGLFLRGPFPHCLRTQIEGIYPRQRIIAAPYPKLRGPILGVFIIGIIVPRPPNVPLLRALWYLLDGIWGLLKGSWGVLVYWGLF